MSLRFFSFLDFFKQPITILFRQQEKASTSLGIFFSFCIIIVLVIILAQSDFFRKKNPTIISQSLSMTQSLPVEVKKETLIAFAVADVNSNSIFDASFFRVEALLINITSLKDGTKNQTQTQLPLKFCEYDDYPQYFVSAGLNGKLCIQNKSFYLEGFYDQPSLQYLSIRLYFCDNATSNGTCKSEESMKKVLDERRFFSMIIQSTTTELLDYTNPFRYQMITTYQALDFSLTKRYNIFLKKNQVNTEEGIFFSSIKSLYEMTFDYKEFDFIKRASNQPLFQFLVYASINAQQNDRKYQSFTELISLLVSTAHFLISIFMILVKIDFKLYNIVSIINSLYGFKILHSNHTKRSLTYLSNGNDTKFSLPLFNLDSKRREAPKLHIQLDQKKKKSLMLMRKESISPILSSKRSFNSARHEKEAESDYFYDENKLPAHTDRPMKSMTNLGEGIKDKVKQNEGNDSFVLENFSNEQAGNEIELVPSNFNATKSKNGSLINRLISNFKYIKERYKSGRKKGGEASLKEEDFVLKLNLIDYFMIKMKEPFQRMKKKKEELAYLEAEKIYLNELDIYNILKRIHDIEKLKLLLLDKDQLNVFDNLSRNLIYINNNDQRKTKNDCQNFVNRHHLRLDNSLKNITKNKNDNEINKKLLFILQSKFYDNLLISSKENI